MCELSQIGHATERLRTPFKYSFANATSRFVSYMDNPVFVTHLKRMCKLIKQQDNRDESLDLQKRGMRHEPVPRGAHMSGGCQPIIFDSDKPMHGEEFFFSNVLVKVYQIPMLFATSSELGVRDDEATFVIIIYEKLIKKRQVRMKEDKRMQQIIKAQKQGNKRHATEQLMIRESKMRRFCNFWLILFNVRTVKPFSQLVKMDDMKELKMRVTLKV